MRGKDLAMKLLDKNESFKVNIMQLQVVLTSKKRRAIKNEPLSTVAKIMLIQWIACVKVSYQVVYKMTTNKLNEHIITDIH